MRLAVYSSVHTDDELRRVGLHALAVNNLLKEHRKLSVLLALANTRLDLLQALASVGFVVY